MTDSEHNRRRRAGYNDELAEAVERVGHEVMRERLMRHVQVNDAGCWIWRGGQTRKGHPHSYGVVSCARKMRTAHRVSYVVHHGPIPPGHEVGHRCHTPLCINPDCLEAVTHRDNMRYARDSGRQTKQRLTRTKVEMIRWLHASFRSISLADIGRLYGVSRETISNVCTRNGAWPDVARPPADWKPGWMIDLDWQNRTVVQRHPKAPGPRSPKRYYRRAVMTPNGRYESIKEAAEAHGILPGSVHYRLNTQKLGWSYASGPSGG